MNLIDQAAAELGIDAGELAATLDPTTARSLRRRCRCGNPIENKYGTCDECEDGAYKGDGFGRW